MRRGRILGRVTEIDWGRRGIRHLRLAEVLMFGVALCIDTSIGFVAVPL